MSNPEPLYVRLDFRPGSSSQDQDADHDYLFKKLSELIKETSAFESYRVLTDEDHPFTPGDQATLGLAKRIVDLQAAHGGHWGEHPDHPVDEWQFEVSENSTRLGYWDWVDSCVCDEEANPVENPDPEPGPTYDVWIAEPEGWAWASCGMTFTCEDDPDGIGARRSAHAHARCLRKTYPCAFVAVRPADKGLPLPVKCDS